MISFLSYFIVPTVIFLALVKLNNKRRWLTARRDGDYRTAKGKEVDKIMFWCGVVVFFLFWPLALPILMVGLAMMWAVHWLTNGEGAIPMNKIDQYNDRNRY